MAPSELAPDSNGNGNGETGERPPMIRLNSSLDEAKVDSPTPTPHQEKDDPTKRKDSTSTGDGSSPAYGDSFNYFDAEQGGLGTHADVASDGRVNIRIDQKTKGLSSLLVPALRSQLDLIGVPISSTQPPIPAAFTGVAGQRPPALNVVIHVVGSRGDVQPFVALGKVLKEQYNHRVRLATHPVFKDFVRDHGLEFFSIGGDPSELMAFMVKNPGLMPGFDTLRSGDIGKRRRGIAEMIKGCWRSCVETGDGLGPDASQQTVEAWVAPEEDADGADQPKPFVAEAIIANPPSFAHIHCAEKLGVPLHMMFTMPWSPTRSFPHPLANIQASNTDADITNFLSYALVDMMTWQGLGDVINRFRQKSLGLEPVSMTWAPGMLERMRIPWTYCWSPALIPKPGDWAANINISGFYFLSMATNYTPDSELAAFLDAGPPPVYIGFGSIVVDDPDGMTRLIFDAVKKTGQRALVSKGWGGFGAEEMGIPENVFMLGNVPHDWLFQRVSCVVHHGGAGTTAAGIACGKPTLVVPFFGDQPFWGAMVARAGAGPNPVPYKQLNAQILADSIMECLKPERQEKAKILSERIATEKGTDVGAKSFHQSLDFDKLRCQLCPGRVAVWRIKRTEIRLSAFAATVLVNEGLLTWHDLKLYRVKEYETDEGPWDPVTGGASALIGTLTSMSMGIADFPVETLKALKIHPDTKKPTKADAEAGETKNENKPSSRDQTPAPTKVEETSTSQGATGQELKADTSPRPDGKISPLRRLSPARLRSSSDTSKSPAPSRGRSRSNSKEELRNIPAYSGPQVPASPVPDPRTVSPVPGGRARSTSNNFSIPDAIAPALSTGKGVYRIAGESIKSPMDFSIAIAKGFHNAPKLYNDETVREYEKITGVSSGLKAAGKEFGYGLYDGVTGLFTHPISGAKKEGAAGFLKGFGKGLGGIVLKPSAGFWAIPAYTSKGLYKELYKNYGTSLENYILASRTAQGFEEAQKASPQEREAVINHWKQIRHYIRKKQSLANEHIQKIQEKYLERTGRRESQGIKLPPILPPRGIGTPVSAVSTNESTTSSKFPRTSTMASMDSSIYSPDDSKIDPWPHLPTEFTQSSTDTSSVTDTASTSTGVYSSPTTYSTSPSVLDTTESASTIRPNAQPGATGEEREMEAAIAASIQETSRGNPEEDKKVERAIRAAFRELQLKQAKGANEDDVQQVIQTSIARAQQGTADPEKGASYNDDQAAEEGGFDGVSIDDEELQRVLEESKKMEEERVAEDEKAKREEEIVMQYIMKQSLAEEEHRKKREANEV